MGQQVEAENHQIHQRSKRDREREDEELGEEENQPFHVGPLDGSAVLAARTLS
jgi:hypothetical protein